MAANLGFPSDDEDIRDDGAEGPGGATVTTATVAEDPLTLDPATVPPACPIPPATGEPIAGAIECTNCQSPMAKGESFCRRCGFYPSLNICVEVDPQAEAQSEGAVEPAKSHLEVWKSLIPTWAWAIIAGVVVLFAVSLVARLVVPAGQSRAIWTYAQFALGLAVVIAAHIACYMSAIMINDTLGFIDIILKPIVIWNATVNELPKTFKRVALGAWGVSAMLFAAVVVAGVRYDEIIDWGEVPPKKKAKPNIAVPIDVPPDDKSMEEALEEFTDKAGVEMTEADLEKLKANRQKSVKCLIIGFKPNRETDFDSLVLAVEEGGKWRYAGIMSEGVTVEVRSILNRRMRTIRRSTPVVPCDVKAIWLEPKLMCRIWYQEWNAEQQLVRPLFDKLQPDFVLPKQP